MTESATNYGDILKEWRDRNGFELSDLAGMVGLGNDQLVAIEEGREEPTFELLRKFSSVTGLELEYFDPELDDAPESRPEVATLLKSETRNINTVAFPPIFEATEIAHQITQVEQWQEKPNRFESIRRDFQGFDPNDSNQRDWEQGEALAGRVRENLDLGLEPIDSVYRLALEIGVAVIEVRLPEANFTAMALADEYHGPAIILNLASKAESVLPRRFAVAHELCHILFDRNDLQPVKQFDREVGFFEDQRKPSVERRADAFAINLLCPHERFLEYWDETARPGKPDEVRIQEMIRHFGVGLEATLGHLKSVSVLSDSDVRNLGHIPPDNLVDFEERFWPHVAFDDRACLNALTLPRRGLLLNEVIAAYDHHAIGRSKVLEFLDISGNAFEEHIAEWEMLARDYSVA